MSTIVQAYNGKFDNTTAPAIPFKATATAGNLLAVSFAKKSDFYGIEVIESGWTVIGATFATSDTFAGIAVVKVSDGTETGISFRRDNSDPFASTADHFYSYAEISLGSAVSVIDASYNAANVGSAVTSTASGTATPTGDGTSIGLFMGRAGINLYPMTYDTGFTVANDGTDAAEFTSQFSSSECVCAVSVKDFTGTSAQQMTANTTDTGGYMWAGITIVQVAASGSIPPSVFQNANQQVLS